MSLPDLAGHIHLREALARSAQRDSLPQSILLHGPAGIGKERLGLWLGQLLLCESDGEAAPCDSCRSCLLARRLEHPDLHWFFPLPRPSSGPPEKQREKLEEARAEELRLRRSDPLHRPSYDKAPAYFVGSVQTIRAMAASRPAMGSRKVFVVGDAELMVPQESSQEAANAFLKLLEEPPADTTLVLTSHRPGSLLPTILSRVLPVRVPPLSQRAIADFLVDRADLPRPRADEIATLADGSLGRALDRATGDRDDDAHEAGRRLLEAALDRSPVARLGAALAQGPFGARGEEFQDRLDALSLWLRDLAAVAAGSDDDVRSPEAHDFLRKAVREAPIDPVRASRAIDRIDEVRRLAFGNVNPQLLLADLLRGLHLDLRGTG